MNNYEKIIHKALIAILFSVMNWILITTFIIEISFLKYLIVETVLVLWMKVYKFTLNKFKL
jgi:hypothetical protein